ncbi:hypothetical protein MKW94_002777 [Papaver nudicaule]|uniref:Uncharacterized protein n=1 Tax=Papaver nudicaule TaxID=74823 RepID=A0AA41VUE6_PAPNU|nr:hypothetical protein [Papaver nudicaule]
MAKNSSACSPFSFGFLFLVLIVITSYQGGVRVHGSEVCDGNILGEVVSRGGDCGACTRHCSNFYDNVVRGDCFPYVCFCCGPVTSYT